MQKHIIEATDYSPEIIFDPEAGLLEIKGKSYPENTFEFYKPLMEWLESYFDAPAKNTMVNMEIIYFNSSSSKFFFDLFDLLEENKDKSDIVIYWIYDKENESALEAGEDFKEDFEDLDFRLIPKEM
jgi:hypothetical protein